MTVEGKKLKHFAGSMVIIWNGYMRTNNLEKRLVCHNEGKGAKYTRARRPVELVYYETFQTKEEAMRREREIKRMSRENKLLLIGHCLAHTGAKEKTEPDKAAGLGRL